MNMKIRKVEEEDIVQISEIESICFPEKEAAAKDVLLERIRKFPEHFLAAEINLQLVGFINGLVSDEKVLNDIMYENPDLHNEKGKYQMVFGLDVLPEYRHRGIAGQLLNKMIENAKQENREGIVLTCKQNLVPFYEKFGFVNKGTSGSTHGDAVWHDMYKKL